MSSPLNGWHDGHADPLRRLRYDLSTAIDPGRSAVRRRGESSATDPRPGASGRRLVIAGVGAVLVFWAVLYAFFYQWRERYRVRAAYGANQVAPEVVAFAERTPTGVETGRWRDAVDRTCAMLVTVTRANVLDMDDLHELREELRRAADRARANPGTAVAELAGIWDEMSERGEFLLRDTRTGDAGRHPRPALLPSYGDDRVAPGLDPMAGLQPPGVEPGRWREAVGRTRALLHDVTAGRRISTMRMMALRKEIDRAADRARAHPESAVGELAGVWDSLARSCSGLFRDPSAVLARHPRPAIFPPG